MAIPDEAAARFENEVVIALVNSLLGVIPPEVREVFVVADREAALAQVSFVVDGEEAIETRAELFQEVLDDVDVLLHGAVKLRAAFIVAGEQIPDLRRSVFIRWPG